MRKSPAITASPSTTRLTARLSGTNQAWKAPAIRASNASGSTVSIRTRHEVRTDPGAAASQSAGKRSKCSPEKGAGDTPSAKSV